MGDIIVHVHSSGFAGESWAKLQSSVAFLASMKALFVLVYVGAVSMFRFLLDPGDQPGDGMPAVAAPAAQPPEPPPAGNPAEQLARGQRRRRYGELQFQRGAKKAKNS